MASEESFHEPNLGFESLMSKWKAKEEAATSGGTYVAVGIAKRKTRDEAKQEFLERKRSLAMAPSPPSDTPTTATAAVDGEGKWAGVTKGSAKKMIVTRAHFRNVYQQPLPADVNLSRSFKSKKDKADNDLILSALSKNFVFADLGKEALAPLVEAFEPCSFNSCDVIIRQGDAGDFFYIIKSGKVTFQVNGVDVGSAQKGSSFGELSLLYTVRRVVVDEPQQTESSFSHQFPNFLPTLS